MRFKFLSFGLILLCIGSFAQESGNSAIEIKFGYSALSNSFNRSKDKEINVSYINGINSSMLIPLKKDYLNLLVSGELQFGREYLELEQGWEGDKFETKMNSAGIYLGLNVKNGSGIIGLNSNIALGYNHSQRLLFYNYEWQEDVVVEDNVSSLGGFFSVGPYLRIKRICLYPAFYGSYFGNKDLSGFFYGANFSIGLEL